MDAAQQLASVRVVVGFPEQRLSDLAAKISRVAAQYCAVLDSQGGRLIGLIRFSAVAAHPSTSQRILSDLMSSPPENVLLESAPAAAADAIMTDQGLPEIAVVSSTGVYRGMITPESFTAWHLAHERELKLQLEKLLGEQARMTDFLEKRVNARMDEIRATLGEFEAMCLTLSHDIRAPLRSARGYAQTILEDHGKWLWPEAKALVIRIEEVAGKGESLADNLLGAARKSFGDQSRAITAIDLNVVFSDALQFLDATIRDRKAQVATSGALHPVGGYYFPLLQIFVNLIGNAIKYVAPDRRPLVMVWTEQTEAGVVLRIKDNGVGIPDLEQQGLFRPYGAAGKRPESGSGLGLSIVVNAVAVLEGRIEAARASEGGSLFTVTLPRA